MVGCLMTPASWLARTDIVRQTGGCDERIYTQDYGLNIKLARLGPIAELQESLYLMPADMGDRNSGNPTQERHDETEYSLYKEKARSAGRREYLSPEFLTEKLEKLLLATLSSRN